MGRANLFDPQDYEIEYAVALVNGIPVCVVEIGETTRDGNLDGLLDVIDFISKQSAAPSVVTYDLALDEDTVPRSLTR